MRALGVAWGCRNGDGRTEKVFVLGKNLMVCETSYGKVVMLHWRRKEGKGVAKVLS